MEQQDSTQNTTRAVLDLMLKVCRKAEQEAQRCGKHSLDIYEQCNMAKGMQQHCSSLLVQHADELRGQHVLQVAAALQAYTAKLQWCLRKLHAGHAASLRRHFSKHQARHVLAMLAAAQEAQQHLSTAFQLAVMASRQQGNGSWGQQQQQQQSQASRCGSWGQQQQHSQASRPGTLHLQPSASSKRKQRGSEDEQHGQQQQACPVVAPQEAASAAAVGSKVPGSTKATSDSEATPGLAAGQVQLKDDPAAVVPDNERQAYNIPAVDAQPIDWEASQEGWEQLLQQARQGDVGAVLACVQELMAGGEFCEQDFGLARQLLLTTVEQGVGTACLWLGQLAEQGCSLPAPDYEAAADWFGKGAALGHLECAQALGFYYENGLGLAADMLAAKEWYEYCAQHGHAAAQNNLGCLLLKGVDANNPPDAPAAQRWFLAAAEQGSSAAWLNLGLCYEQQALQAASAGSTSSSSSSGAGSSAKQDSAAAAACYEQAGQLGSVRALMHLGHLRQQQQQYAEAKHAFQAAADLGSAEALVQLARLAALDVA